MPLSDPRASGAAFSTVVRASTEDTAFHVHGIEPCEIAAGPVFSEAWSRFPAFVENLQMVAVQDCSDSECEQEEWSPMLSSEPPAVLMEPEGRDGELPCVMETEEMVTGNVEMRKLSC